MFAALLKTAFENSGCFKKICYEEDAFPGVVILLALITMLEVYLSIALDGHLFQYFFLRGLQ